MNDDWRLRIDLHEDGFAHQLGETLQAEEVEHDLKRSFSDRVVVTVDGHEVFCYTGTREQAQAAEQVVRSLATRGGWTIDVELRHWQPELEEWEPADAPPPTGADVAEEHAEHVAQERTESADQGYPEYEVRITCGSRREAGKVSDRLEHEGIPNIHRWNWVFIGATDEDSAKALAARLQGELPGTEMSVELNERAVWDGRPANPFAFLGGLAG